MKSKRILVTGGRDNYDWKTVEFVFDMARKDGEIDRGDILVHGAASGIDSICAMYWIYYGMGRENIEAHPAQWKVNGKFDPTAGSKRNQEMVDSGIDLAFAFKGGTGTEDAVRRITRAGIALKDYRPLSSYM